MIREKRLRYGFGPGEGTDGIVRVGIDDEVFTYRNS